MNELFNSNISNKFHFSNKCSNELFRNVRFWHNVPLFWNVKFSIFQTFEFPTFETLKNENAEIVSLYRVSNFPILQKYKHERVVSDFYFLDYDISKVICVSKRSGFSCVCWNKSARKRKQGFPRVGDISKNPKKSCEIEFGEVDLSKLDLTVPRGAE